MDPITIYGPNDERLVCTDYDARKAEPPCYHPDRLYPGAPAEFDPVEGYVELDGVKRELTNKELAVLSERFRLEYLEMEEDER